jgi:hypothetical protein
LTATFTTLYVSEEDLTRRIGLRATIHPDDQARRGASQLVEPVRVVEELLGQRLA